MDYISFGIKYNWGMFFSQNVTDIFCFEIPM